MRCGFTLGFCLVCCCSLDTRPLSGTGSSVSSESRQEPRLARTPSISLAADAGRLRDSGRQQDASTMTATGDGKAQLDAGGVADVGAPRMDPQLAQPMMPAAKGGSSGMLPVAATAGSGGAASVSGREAQPSAGAAAPNTKDALIGVLQARASMNGADELLIRSVLAQIDTPFPGNAGSMRLLLTTALTSFGCPDMSSRDCEVICDYVGDSCLTCLSDAQCREQLVLVCPSALNGCRL